MWLPQATQPFCARGFPPIYLAPAWNNWTDAVLEMAWNEVRRQRVRWAEQTKLQDNANSLQGLATRNENNFLSTGPAPEDDQEDTSVLHLDMLGVARGTPGQRLEEGTAALQGDDHSLVTASRGTRKWGKPSHSLESWAARGPGRGPPQRADHHNQSPSPSRPRADLVNDPLLLSLLQLRAAVMIGPGACLTQMKPRRLPLVLPWPEAEKRWGN